MPGAVNGNDPRVLRTRQLLLQAFTDLVYERKNLHSISVLEIAARATVNRATFYAHFEDKYAFLECWMRLKFQHSLASQLPLPPVLQMDILRMLILAVFDFLATFRQYLKPADRQFEPLFEVVMQRELNEILLQWLMQISSEIPQREKTIKTTALVTSWGIFGSATHWSRGDQTISAEEMTYQVLKVVVAGLSPVAVLV